MPRLFVLSGPDLGQTHTFTQKVRLGRAPSCEVVVRGSSISRAHAELSPEGEAWVIVDLDSSNGVRMGSVRAKRFELSDGDIFKLGDVELRFRHDDVEPEQSAPARSEPTSATPGPVVSESDDDEVTLEEDIDLGEDIKSVTPPPAESAPSTGSTEGRAGTEEKLSAMRGKQAGGRAPAEPQGAAERRARSPRRSAEVTDRRDREILQFSSHRSDSTAFTSDLSQQPLWVRALAILLALGVSAAVFWVAFRGTSSLSGGDEIELEEQR